ncbi:hypothetical protein JT358_13230 [Micrococcales bacterium 31B]|nr:hypothetical protein [Micrococcales bacterium 31B]
MLIVTTCTAVAACNSPSTQTASSNSATIRSASRTPSDAGLASGIGLQFVSARMVSPPGEQSAVSGSGSLAIERNCLVVQHDDGSRQPLVLPWYHTYQATPYGVLVDGKLKLEVGKALPKHSVVTTTAEVIQQLNGSLKSFSNPASLQSCSELSKEFVAITTFYELPQPE